MRNGKWRNEETKKWTGNGHQSYSYPGHLATYLLMLRPLSDWKILYSFINSLEKRGWLCQASMVPPLKSALANLTPEL